MYCSSLQPKGSRELKDTTYYHLRELIKLSLKIDKQKYKSFEEADRLIRQQTDLINSSCALLQDELFTRSRRYDIDPWDW